MNRIHETTAKGTFGELFVQLKLLQYGVQAAPPLKDSGNDLIGIRGEVFRAIQVKTRTANGEGINLGGLPELYHIIAVVLLDERGIDPEISVDRVPIFLITKQEFEQGLLRDLSPYAISLERVERLFSASI